METYFQMIEIIVGVLNTFEDKSINLSYKHIAGLCHPWDLTDKCYIFELNDGSLDCLYTPFGKQMLTIPNFITPKILEQFKYIFINDSLLITHIQDLPIYYPNGDYFIPNSKLDYTLHKQQLNHEIKRLVSLHYLTDDFGALDQLVSMPDDYSVIIDIIGNQNIVSCKLAKQDYMMPTKFMFLHMFGLIIMTKSNVYLRT